MSGEERDIAQEVWDASVEADTMMSTVSDLRDLLEGMRDAGRLIKVSAVDMKTLERMEKNLSEVMADLETIKGESDTYADMVKNGLPDDMIVDAGWDTSIVRVFQMVV